VNIPNAFALLLNILLRPTKWQTTVASIDPDLPLDFSILEVTSEQWRRPIMWRVFVNGYLLLPLLLFGASVFMHLIFGRSIDGVLAAFSFMLIIGLTVGMTMSTAAGIAVIAIVGTSAALLWPPQQVLMFDMITSVRYAHLYGLTSAVLLIVSANCTRHTLQEALSRQIGGIVIGLIASAVIMVATTFLIITTIQARQTNSLPGNSVGIVLALQPLLLLGIAAYLQSRSVWRAIVVGLGTAILFVVGFGRTGSEYGLEFGGNELLIGMNAVGLMMFLVLTALPFALTRRFVGTWPAFVAAAFGGLAIYIAYERIFTLFDFWGNLLLAIAFIIGGLTFGWIWSAVAYLFEAGWNTLLYRLDSAGSGPVRWLKYHAVFWDEIQQIPFFELSDYLVLAAGREAATPNLAESSPEQHSAQSEPMLQLVNESRQQWAAQAARIELDARRLEALKSVESLARISDDSAAGLLSTPAGLMLRNFARLGADVGAALAQPSPYNQRLVLSSVAHALENLQSELARDGRDRLAVRYQSVARQWHKVVTDHIAELDHLSLANGQIPNPYIVGVPLTRRQEIFVGRTDIARYVEDILRTGDHPPVLLYGPRRMGKTSLLYQLNWMLPRRILPLVVDLQGPISLASNNVGFLHAFARGVRQAAARNEITLPQISREALEQEPFTIFDDWLNQVGQIVIKEGHETVLLALDEFEALDESLSAGVLEERAILGMLRHIVQHRRGVKLLLSGSHTLDEFRRWSSYLINAQVVELGYLEEAEARQLIESPIQEFPLRYEPNAVRHVLYLTQGHPYLVQLLCMEIVAYKNRQAHAQRHLATAVDVEQVIPAMLERGQQFFADIELNQVDEDGRFALRWLAIKGAGYYATVEEFDSISDELEGPKTLQQLVRRSILTNKDGQVCFQIEAVRRWFGER